MSYVNCNIIKSFSVPCRPVAVHFSENGPFRCLAGLRLGLYVLPTIKYLARFTRVLVLELFEGRKTLYFNL